MATAGSTDEPELCQNLDKHVLILSLLCAAVFIDTAEFTERQKINLVWHQTDDKWKNKQHCQAQRGRG